MSISCDSPSGHDAPKRASRASAATLLQDTAPQSEHHEHQLRPSFRTRPQSKQHEHQLRPSFRRRDPKASIMSISSGPPSGHGHPKRASAASAATLLQDTAPQKEHHEHQLRLSFRARPPKASIMSISCDPPSGHRHHEHQLQDTAPQSEHRESAATLLQETNPQSASIMSSSGDRPAGGRSVPVVWSCWTECGLSFVESQHSPAPGPKALQTQLP